MDLRWVFRLVFVRIWVVFLRWISWFFWGLVFVMWLVLMVKAYQMVKFKLPIIGDIAEKNS